MKTRPKWNGRVFCRFSCGAASAVATKLALDKYPEAEITYSDTGSEHPDNKRFLAECEKWFGRKIRILKSEKYNDIWELFDESNYLVGFHGAPCTGEMKRKPSEKEWQIGDLEIFGYTAEEGKRLEKWKNHNLERLIECPLIENQLSKSDCFGVLERVGIDLPVMYKLGFRNNNCIGCVKARDSADYWKRVRKYFPDKFERLAVIERRIGWTINRVQINGKKHPYFLDELEEGDPKGADPDISCGLFCQAVTNQFED